ncbi:MAG: cell division protein FtsH, partial [Clostridiales bacterium]|nr:cell division protein FtsH [Clostridiales bacterium]
MKKNRFRNPVFFVLIIIASVILLNLIFGNAFSNAIVDKSKIYSEFRADVLAHKVTEVYLNSSTLEYRIAGDERTKYQVSRVSDDTELIPLLNELKIKYGTLAESNIRDILYIVFTVVLPLALMGFLFFSIFRGMKKGDVGIGGLGFGKTNAKLFTISDGSKKFSDVAGQDEAKEQMMELVDFLHQPDKYKAIGAKLPKGALLVGPPGTGKTLLAQAVAGEADVPFFFVSGSAFVEMFVGAGAARVRDLFKQANEKAPCIVFIDEIDAIGKKRDTTGFAGNDEREQSLNQLLAEMDGFDPGKGIIVLGATNRPEILDQALLRPGRFDRRIAVELPDLKGREAILRVHAKPITLASDVDLAEVAKATVGASGADLANIINESALRAVRENHASVTQDDILASVETVIAGSERKSMVIPEAEKKLVAYHEIGHALAAALQKNTAPVTKITIVPRTSGALGYT